MLVALASRRILCLNRRALTSTTIQRGNNFFPSKETQKQIRKQNLLKSTQSSSPLPSSSPLSQTPIVPTPQEEIDYICKEFTELKSLNPFLVVNQPNRNSLTISFSDNPDISFRFTVKGEQDLQFECPSGEGSLRVYTFNPVERGWLNDKDGHNMHGLMLRDLKPFLTGLPGFAFGGHSKS